MKKYFRWLGLCLAALAAALIIYLAAVLMTIGEQEDYMPPAAEPGMGNALRVVHDTSAQVLADVFGADLFVFEGREITSGVTGNAVHAGRDCHTLQLNFDGGLSVFCVRPVSAAPLLRAEGAEVISSGEISVCNLPSQITRRGDEWHAYLSGESASYRVSGTAADLSAWLEILSSLRAVTPNLTE